MAAKRFHIIDDVWLVRTGGTYMPDYEVEVGGAAVADVYFHRMIDKNGPHITCRITWKDTGVRFEGFASYFADLKKFLRNSVDWTMPGPESVEEFRERLSQPVRRRA